MSNEKKFIVTYGRTIQVAPYESSKIHLTVEYGRDEVPLDYAFLEVKSKVEQWIKELP